MLTDVVIPFKVCNFGSILIQVKVRLHVSDLDVGLDKRRMEIKSLYVSVLQNKTDKIIQFIAHVHEMLLIMDSKCHRMFFVTVMSHYLSRVQTFPVHRVRVLYNVDHTISKSVTVETLQKNIHKLHD